MKRLLLLTCVMLVALCFVLYFAPAIDAWDPYTPAPGSFDGLTPQEIQEKEQELEATKMIDQEAQQEVSRGAERTMMVEATAYYYENMTYTGTCPVEGRTVEVDPAVIPLKSRLIINGKSGYIAEDTGRDY